ncbi:hypothetical protein D3C73_780040 [compost metagenome]
MHLHIFVLADPKSTVGRLILHRRVPPAVVMQHMVGPCQIKPHTSGFERQYEKGRAFPLLESMNHFITLPLGNSTVQKERSLPVPSGQSADQKFPHRHILGKDQGRFSKLGNAVEHLEHHFHFAGSLTALSPSFIPPEKLRMITDLLQLGQGRQHQSPAGHA